VAEALDHRVGVLRAERLQQHGRRIDLAPGPARATVEELRSGGAEQQDRRVPRQIGDVLDEVEERLLAPVDVVEDADDRSDATVSSSFRNAYAISSRDVGMSSSRKRAAIASVPAPSNAAAGSCFATSTTGQ
jgi:hypothetical protein